MRLVIISDTHFGDPACGLVNNGDTTGRFVALLDEINKGDVDFLVMAGDVFDQGRDFHSRQP